MNIPQQVQVNVLKHDGREYRRWNGRLTRDDGSLIVLDAEFDVDVSHEILGEIKQRTRTVEYYWRDRWYNIFRFLNEDGTTRLWYCNVTTPPQFKKTMILYIDLDIDIVVEPDFSFRVLDLDEFESNAETYGYSAAEKQHAQAAVEELVGMINRRQFPFLPEHSFEAVAG